MALPFSELRKDSIFFSYLVYCRHRYILTIIAIINLQDLNEWLQVLQQMAEEREARVQRMVRQSNLSQELSDLVVYCQPVQFDIESTLLWNSSDNYVLQLPMFLLVNLLHLFVLFSFLDVSGKHYEMSSFPETRLEKFVSKKWSKEFVKYPFSFNHPPPKVLIVLVKFGKQLDGLVELNLEAETVWNKLTL